MNNFTRMTLVLFVVCGAAAGALAFVNQITKPKIIAQAKLEKSEALKEVLPEADDFREVVPDKVWDALKGGERIGSVIITAAQGYSGNIGIVIGLDAGDSVTGLKILSQSETPGLGAKIVERAFLDQFRGKRAESIALKKDDPSAGGIDAISAATISSRAVTNTVRSAVDSFAKGELK
jgi:H+/Na+-translocating ferredoxin:NAD+ oxidoreductase subunit G